MYDFDARLQCEDIYNDLEDSDHCLLCGESLANCLCYEIETSTNLPAYDDDLPF